MFWYLLFINGLVLLICCRCFIVKWQSINVFGWRSWCLPFKFIDLVEYLMDLMVNTKRTRAKIVVEPEKRSFFCESSSSISTLVFGELFLLFRHLEGAYIPRGHPKKPVFFAVKLVWNGWLLNLFCFRANPPNKNPYLFCLDFKPKEIWLEKMELHLWVQGFWSQNELQKEDQDIISLSFLTAVPFELWYWTTVR